MVEEVQIKGMRNLHKDCRLKGKCAACGEKYGSSYWGKHAVKNYHHQGTVLVCRECTDKGCTARDLSLYTCRICLRKLGKKKYDTYMIHHYNSRKSGEGEIECIECTDGRKAKIRQLQRQLQSSKRVCKCYCPIHTRTCPLTPCYHNERRWPGSDKKFPGREERFISAEDRIFLDSLQPPPNWLGLGIF